MRRYAYMLTLFLQAPACLAQNAAADDYIGFYQKFLSGQKNSRCAMYPSCSRYGQEAFKEFPFFKAAGLVCERLMRCSHDAQYYDATYQYGYRSLIDCLQDGCPVQGIIHNRFPSPHTDMLKRRDGRDSSVLFVNRLINKEEYVPALLEIERLLFSGRGDVQLYRQKLLCRRGTKDYEKGIFEYEAEFPDAVKRDAGVRLQAAMLYYCAGNFDGAINLAGKARDGMANSPGARAADALCAVSMARKGEYDAAAARFRENAGAARTNRQSAGIIARMAEAKKKKPALARILSVVPGAGYLYAGHKGSALTAFVVNSLLGYATYTSIKRKNYGAAGICGFLSLSFYIGNINGAGRSAVRYNSKKKDEQIRELEKINNIFIN